MLKKISVFIGVLSSGVALAAVHTHKTHAKSQAAFVVISNSPEDCKNIYEDSECKITVTLKNEGDNIADSITTPPQLPDDWSNSTSPKRCPPSLSKGADCQIVLLYKPTAETKHPFEILKYVVQYRDQKTRESFRTADLKIPYSKKIASIITTFSPTQCENTVPHSVPCDVALTFTKVPSAGEITHLKLKPLNGKDSDNGWTITSQGECARVDEHPSTCRQTLSFKPTNKDILPDHLVVQFSYDVDGIPSETFRTQGLPYNVNEPAVIGKFYDDKDREISSIVGKLGDLKKIKLRLTRNPQYETIFSFNSFDGEQFKMDNPQWTSEIFSPTQCLTNINKSNGVCDIELTFKPKTVNEIKSKDIVVKGPRYRLPDNDTLFSPKIKPFTYSTERSNILKWTADLHAPVMANPIISHNTGREGHIFVGTTNGINEIEDLGTGDHIKKTFATHGSFCEGPYPECPDTPLIFPKEGAMQYLYVPTSNGLNIFEPNSQHPLRFIPENGAGLRTTSPVFIGNDMYFATSSRVECKKDPEKPNDPEVCVLHPWSKIFKSQKDGTSLTEFQVDYENSILPDIAQTSVEGDEGDDPLFGGGASKTLYFGTSDGKFHALNTLNPSCPVWDNGDSIQIAEPKTPVEPPVAINSPLSRPTITDDGTIYIGDLEGKLTKVSSNGTKTTLFDCTKTIVNCKIITKPTVGTDGTIYIGTYAGGTSVYAIDPKSSNPANFKWKFTTRGGITAAPVLADDILFVTSADRTLYALDAKTNNKDGRELWEFSTENALYTSPVVNTKENVTTVYFGDNANPGGGAPAGFFYALDYSKGPQP